MSGKREDQSTGTLGKAVAVLDAIASSPEPLRFKDLAGLIDQPRGTLHRQISNLIGEGLVHVNADQSYSLGTRLLKFASLSWSKNRFRNIAEPHLRVLHDQTGETVHLGILQGTEVIYLDKVESRQAVRMHSQIGNASPAYCTGVGKAALSVLADEDLQAIAERISYVRYTPHTIAGASKLLEEISTIRREGVAYDREEHESGIKCVAAPITSADRRLAAGISVTGPAYRVKDGELRKWAPLVRSTARDIEEDLRMHLGPRS